MALRRPDRVRLLPGKPDRALTHEDLDAAIARLRDALGGRDEKFALAASVGLDVRRRDATTNQLGAHRLGALTGQRIVEWVTADGVGMPDYDNVRNRAAGDLRKHAFDDLL